MAVLSKPPKRSDFGGPGACHGTAGRKIALKANFFPVQFDPKQSIFHYDVAVIKPSHQNQGRDLPKKLCENVVRQFIEDFKHTRILKNTNVAYDSRRNLYCSAKIPEEHIPNGTRKTFEVQYSKPGSQKSECFEVQLRFAQEIRLDSLNHVFKGRKELDDQVVVQALDIVMQHGFKMNDAYTSVGRNFFLKQQERAKDLGVGREIWFGFHQSLRPGENSMLLNIDVAATTFYKGQPLIDYAAQILYPLKQRRDGPPAKQQPLKHRIDERQKKQLEKEIREVKIETAHGKHKRRYKIYKLSKETAKSATFRDSETGLETTVENYFKDKYMIRLKYPDLPLVLMQPRDKNIQIPMELCFVQGGQHYRKKLDSQGTADMVRACANPAPERAKMINSYAKNNDYNHDDTIVDFGLKVSRHMIELQGRVLPNRRMITKGKRRDGRVEDVQTEPRRGVWQTERTNYYDPQSLKRWTLYCTENERFCDESTIRSFVKKLQQGGRQVGMMIADPVCPKYLMNVDEVERAMREARDHDYQQVIFILGKQTGNPFYAKIKQVGDVKFGVRTQCITSTNVKRANNQLIGNILLKINGKLNGVNNICKNPDGSLILPKPTMIMGADVTHPAPGDNSRPSIAAVVASMNASATVYHSEIRVQAHRQETIGSTDETKSPHLEDMVVECLKQFYRSTKGVKPVHLMYFRDGVSEGQYQEMIKHELKQIFKACQRLSGDYKPTVTFVVCTKRHHARMFTQYDQDADGKSRNIPAGTIVDTTITSASRFDFYLCSHAGIQGTSRPTLYTVLYNNDKDIAETPDKLQSLTYSLCHVYQRCQRSVSIPAPVYYAHLGAYRATIHLSNEDDGASSTYSGDDNISLNSEGASQLQDRVKLHDKLRPTRNAQTNALLGCQHFM